MKRVQIFALLLVVVLMTTGCLFGGSDEKDVLKQVENFYQAQLDDDEEALAATLAEDAEYVALEDEATLKAIIKAVKKADATVTDNEAVVEFSVEDTDYKVTLVKAADEDADWLIKKVVTEVNTEE